MNALIIDNNFNGAYGSFYIFLNEIIKALRNMEISCFYVSSTIEAVDVYKKHNIDFSIGIGQYRNYYNDIPLYEVYKTIHFQWQIDNPLKNQIDFKSIYIQYLVISQDFLSLMKSTRRTPIFIPLGFDGEYINSNFDDQVDGVVFCGQIKSLSDLKDKMQESKYFKIISEITNRVMYNNNTYFIKEMLNFGIDKWDKESLECFSIANSYLRAWSRVTVITSIKKYPVYIIGDVNEPSVMMQNNIHFIGKRTYKDTLRLLSRFKYSLNISPNYRGCLHDRCLRSIVAGTYVINNFDEFVHETFKGSVFSFKYDESLKKLDEYFFTFNEIKRKEAILKSQQYAQKYNWISILKYIINRGVNNETT